ncbi:MAG TPA: diguanylate cyclase [Humisphaera sp.]
MGHRILIIDDSPVIHALVRAELSAEGIEVLGARDGQSGIMAAREHRPDLILLDVTMPGMDGYEVCELLQVQPETALTPVIFLSGTSTPQDRVRGLERGASDYMAKPFTGAELRARVRVSMRHKARLEMASRRAMRDGMTGLWNRAYLDDRLAAESAAADRHARPLSCLMVDVDHFKSINDRHGHPFGDEVIRRVAEALSAACRREDVACRYGGEEFAVLCPGVPASGAEVLGERVRREVEGLALDGPDGAVRVTASIGVAERRAGTPPTDLVSAADAALYDAKRGGRNRVCAARPTTAAA